MKYHFCSSNCSDTIIIDPRARKRILMSQVSFLSILHHTTTLDFILKQAKYACIINFFFKKKQFVLYLGCMHIIIERCKGLVNIVYKFEW